jgi:hypothetical protein
MSKVDGQDYWASEPSRLLRAFARALLSEDIKKQLEPLGMGDDRLIVTMLLMAFLDAVRDEWRAAYTAAGLEREVEIARRLMKDAGYDDLPETEPIVGHPGAKPMICKIDDKEAVAYSHSLAGVMPLSAYFTNKVREAIDIAAMLGELVGEEAKPAPEPEEKPHDDAPVAAAEDKPEA